MRIKSDTVRTIVVSGVVAAMTAGGGVYAANMVGANDIKDDAVRPRHINEDAVKNRHINEDSVRGRHINEDAVESRHIDEDAIESRHIDEDAKEELRGRRGPEGEDATYQNPQWGIITRNHIGSAVAALRGGPFGTFGVEGESGSPPYGVGSLGIAVSDNAMSGDSPQEKAAFGNELDFFGDQVSGITELGFHVFQTNENHSRAPENLPNIQFEIDPNLEASTSNYSTMSWQPDPIAEENRNRWSPYIDATDTGEWWLTGAAGTATGCNQATTCTYSELQTALADGGDEATVYTVAVTKGRDHAWVGAVDGLRINNTIHNFEPFGVNEQAAG